MEDSEGRKKSVDDIPRDSAPVVGLDGIGKWRRYWWCGG